MHLERRPLYNLLRMHWLLDPTMSVEPWQVEDYRVLSFKVLFDRLNALGLGSPPINRPQFVDLAENFNSPEELAEFLLERKILASSHFDQAYLILFELWRRLIPEKPSLSIFCDELDYQIHLYDQGTSEKAGGIPDTLANLQIILDENADQGASPTEVFKAVCNFLANNLEQFLYDFISDQIDLKNSVYASELVEGFFPYIPEQKWFLLLKAKIYAQINEEAAGPLLAGIVKEAAKGDDVDFNLEILSHLTQNGERSYFNELVRSTLPLLKEEDEFQELLEICTDYFRRLDLDHQELIIQNWLAERASRSPHEKFSEKDPKVQELLSLLTV